MGLDQVISVIALFGVLILVLPGFIKTNSEKKIFVKNFSIWGIIILAVMVVLYLVI